ncbi:hypothetical protein [Rhodoferax sp. TS-BS-61-7]|uniref:hypothetical protein n=1 Tax=Rhodoferax sp. TS-BS-61-7 TaxID=2094194 RepID=UPI000CF6187E|nr:hypothetical protein [Rhodoferax sp. TS-BS-61-7]PQA78142.1 hypothetical protein C5F53_07375 [Rhodoferax sp. TS-BS-61-7]
MTSHNTPHNGDFASLLEEKAKNAPGPAADSAAPLAAIDSAIAAQRPQTIDDVLVHGEAPNDEFLEEWNELNSLPEVSDEELARQALNAPGDDGDINTPE